MKSCHWLLLITDAAATSVVVGRCIVVGTELRERS